MGVGLGAGGVLPPHVVAAAVAAATAAGAWPAPTRCTAVMAAAGARLLTVKRDAFSKVLSEQLFKGQLAGGRVGWCELPLLRLPLSFTADAPICCTSHLLSSAAKPRQQQYVFFPLLVHDYYRQPGLNKSLTLLCIRPLGTRRAHLQHRLPPLPRGEAKAAPLHPGAGHPGALPWHCGKSEGDADGRLQAQVRKRLA